MPETCLAGAVWAGLYSSVYDLGVGGLGFRVKLQLTISMASVPQKPDIAVSPASYSWLG